MKPVELTEEEQNFLRNILLKELEGIRKTKQTFNVFDKDDPKAKYLKDSFWELDNFVNSIYNKLLN